MRYVTEGQVRNFKGMSKENVLISGILREMTSKESFESILDIGAGCGDVALAGFADIQATLIDRLAYENEPLAQRHVRVHCDLFDWDHFERRHKTLLFCHSLQFFNNQLPELKAFIEAQSPEIIITVTNDNTLEFGEFVNWALEHIIDANPEYSTYSIFNELGFKQVQSIPFSVTLNRKLAESLAYLIDLDSSAIPKIQKYLDGKQIGSSIELNQSVKVYKKEEKCL